MNIMYVIVTLYVQSGGLGGHVGGIELGWFLGVVVHLAVECVFFLECLYHFLLECSLIMLDLS